MLRAPQVSLLTLCPLAQPEKAIGHESQIEPWLTLTTALLDASETDERRYASKMNLENRKNRGSSHQYMGWMSERISLRLPVAGEVFFLDIPFYRTMLHPFGNRRFQDVLIDAVDYAAGRDFCPATSAARFQGSSSSMRLME